MAVEDRQAEEKWVGRKGLPSTHRIRDPAIGCRSATSLPPPAAPVPGVPPRLPERHLDLLITRQHQVGNAPVSVVPPPPDSVVPKLVEGASALGHLLAKV
jgi:hypothetical protein